MKYIPQFMLWALLSAVATIGQADATAFTFRLVKVIHLPTSDMGGDAVTYDPGNHAIYVSMGKRDAGGAIIAANSNALVTVVRTGIVHPAGEAFDRTHVYWAVRLRKDGKKIGRVVVVDKKGWKVVDTFTTVGTTPDGIWTDPRLHRLYVAMDDNNWIDVYRLGKTPYYIQRISLLPKRGDGPDLGTLVPAYHLLYMPDDTWEEKINLRNGKIEHKIDLGTLGSVGDTKGQIYDAQSHTVWVGTDKGGIFVLNAKNMAVEKRFPARAGIDQVAYDPAYHLVYAFESHAKGFNVYNARDMKPLTFVSTGYAATHTGAVDPVTHEVFVYAGADHAVFVYEPVVK